MADCWKGGGGGNRTKLLIEFDSCKLGKGNDRTKNQIHNV